VVDVAGGPLTVAVDGFEAVAGAVFEKCRVVVVGVIGSGAGGPVIGEAGVDAGAGEAIDPSTDRCDERQVDAPGDRMLLVGLGQSEVPPDSEAGRARRLRDLELVEHSSERTPRELQVGDSKGYVVKHR
jgi:hypothetical protein